MTSDVEPRTLFNPLLFWDAEEVQLEKHAAYIIARVLDFGDQEDIKRLRKLFSNEEIAQVVRTHRGLLRKTALFWAAYLRIPLTEIACLKKF